MVASGNRRIRGITLLEILAACALLLIVLAAAGALFRSTSQAIGTSESVLEMTANVRSVERQLATDVASMNRSGFLVIRSRIDPDTNQRYDQLSFLATGSFSSQSGSSDAAHAFDGSAQSPAAHIWWGQLAVQDDTSAADQSAALPLDALPSGILGRHATLLMAAPSASATNISYGSSNVACFSDIRYDTAAANPGLGEPAAHITASRVGVAGITPSQVIASIRGAIADGGGRAQMPTYETNKYCYRFKTLSGVYGSKISLANGYFRMTPIALQNVSSFAVEWTDGFDSSSAATWYGLGGSGKKSNDDPDYASNEPTPAVDSGDQYVAIFSVDTPRQRWPAALRITMQVSDPAGRLAGGRTFVDVLKVPE